MAMPAVELLQLSPPLQNTECGITVGEIERHDGCELSYSHFFWEYMQRNWPVLLTGISTEWECRRNWITPQTKQYTTENDNREGDDTVTELTNNTTSTTAINYDYLRQRVGNCRVPVADCSREYFNSHVKTEMCFHNFLDHWQMRSSECSHDAINSNTMPTPPTPITNTTATATCGNINMRNFYLKDWHLKAQMPEYEFYRVPKHFASDWLNEHLLANGKDDYRFVYMGPKDSWTPFHADVFGSYSWSTNIVGCKKWLMLPPGEELKLSDRLGTLPFCIDEQLLNAKQVDYYTVLQGVNEALFVPSGWHHQVWNIGDTISVNHNWFNACNVLRIWLNLHANMQQVMAEIADCRQMDNFDDHCQTMLRASFGMNYLDFIELLEGVVERRLDCLKATATSPSGASGFLLFDTYAMNEFHVRHDLQSVRRVVVAMLDDEIVCNSRTLLYRRCMRLSELLSEC